MPFIGNQLSTSFQNVETQTITGDGSTSYTLNNAVADGKDLLVYINNVKQEEGSGKSYTATGTTITFTEAVASTDSCYVVFIGQAVGTVTPKDGSIVSSMLADANLEMPNTLDLNGKELILDADADTSITADTDDTIDIKIAGSDVYQITATKIDLNGKELVLDADADTSITADTDDQIDIKIAGTDTVHITSSGIGIGTASISSGFKLEVLGDVRFGDAYNDDAVELGWSSGGSKGFVQAYDRGASAFRNLNLNNSVEIESGGNVGIGTSSIAAKLHVQSGDGSISPSVHADDLLVEGSGNSGITIGSSTSGYGSLRFADSGGDSQGSITYDHSDDTLRFFADDSRAMTIDGSSGNVFIGRTSAGDTGNGHTIRGSDSAIFSRDATGETVQVCRNNDSGHLILFKKNGTTVGNIGVATGGKLQVNSDGNNNLMFAVNGSNYVGIDTVRMYPENDNNYDLGLSSSRYDDIFATNGTIQTSDENEKQDIASATAKELIVAKKLSALFKTFRWKDKVGEKGDKARTHTGIVAQEVQLAFKEEGLDASNYGLFTSDTWTNDDGKEQTRLGVRYPELFSFIFSSIEARLTTLEAK